MGYRSDIELFTTSEGYAMFLKFNSKLVEEARPLSIVTNISTTVEGFYNIFISDVKWYEDCFDEVKNFMFYVTELDKAKIPYKFIRFGEEPEDIQVRTTYDPDGSVDLPAQIDNIWIERNIIDDYDHTYHSIAIPKL